MGIRDWAQRFCAHNARPALTFEFKTNAPGTSGQIAPRGASFEAKPAAQITQPFLICALAASSLCHRELVWRGSGSAVICKSRPDGYCGMENRLKKKMMILLNISHSITID